MQVAVNFRHMETSDPVRDYALEKLERVKKYIEEPVDIQVTLSVEKKIRHIATVTMVAKGVTVKATEETNDMYAAIDAVVDKIERQLKRYKEKIKDHKPASGREKEIQKTVVTAESFDEGLDEPVIIRSHTFSAKPMSPEEAVMQMNLLHKEFIVYNDAQSNEINVVYRRKDGNYGLIVPQQGQ
ncbi:MAG: ribosome-associated translation inhibitor RaiA [Desulfuromonadales bacterium]|nr:ribosome-associated translation inhibitor RaiA [Desulfuromonadales bacterium]NIR34269.1 ribosome-associated translation inhibitor RaiA [Desulfuromonadales bacterium]NIS42847.1 ribosome-associated translation inhibitor RaiA [Desulfuromonadales bacterium]